MTSNTFHPLLFSFTFYFFGLTAIASALAFVTRKNPVAAAMWLVNVMFCLAGLYTMLDAQFMATMQVLVYTGAIMVVFLFVIMLLNLGDPKDLMDARGTGWKVAAMLVSIALLAETMALNRSNTIERMIPPDLAAKAAEAAAKPLAGGIIGPVAAPLFREYLLAFELTSVLLLAAIVGAVVLGKRRTDAR